MSRIFVKPYGSTDLGYSPKKSLNLGVNKNYGVWMLIADMENLNKLSKKDLIKKIEELSEEILLLKQKDLNKNIFNTTGNESEKFIEAIAETANDAIIAIDSKGLVLYWNKAAKNIFGFSRLEMIGNNIDIIIPDQYKENHNNGLKRLRNKEKERIIGKTIEITAINRNGEEFPIDLSLSGYSVNNKKRYTGIIRDIRDKKKALEEVENLADILRQSSDIIMLTDINGQIEYVNHMFEKITGFSFEEVKGRNPNILKSETTHYSGEYYKHMWNTVLKGEIWKGEFINKKKNGGIYIEEASIFPFRDKKSGRITGYGAVKKDVTQSRKMEEALKISYNSVLILKEKAEAANKMKSQFLANMSHDIRTPLNAIMGFTDLISKNENRKETQLYLAKVKSAGEGLLILINDILDFSKIEAGQMDVLSQTFYIKDLFAIIRDIFETQFSNKGLKFEISINKDVPDIVYNDNLRLRQVLDNLLANALKFTSNGIVSLNLDYLGKKDLLYFKIKDTGIGIKSENIERIFDPFTQIADIKSFSEKGTGLGLAICKKLIKLMGGTITVSSKHGEGAEFKFGIPANLNRVKENTVPDIHLELAVPNMDEIKENKILVADDNPVNMELLLEQLRNAGFNNILSAANGTEAVSLATEFLPDLILMDIQMPIMDGNEAINKLKTGGYKGPIIALSAFAMREDIDKSLRLGAVAYITKPIDFNIFFDQIAPFLGKKEAIIPDSVGDKKDQNIGKSGYKIKKSVSERIKNIFLTDTWMKIDKIDKILTENKLEKRRQQLRIIAHGYIGNADYFGLSELAVSADKLEHALGNSEPDVRVIVLSKALKEMLKGIYENNK